MAQQASLNEFLHRCTVRLSIPGGHGTGFFVAPRRILTCAHVVETAQTNETPVTVDWYSQSYTAQIMEYRADADLALLEIELDNHPCVLLYQEAKPFTKLYSYGYPTDYSNGAAATFEVEGSIGDQQEHLKFKEGQVQPGMSGAALLNWMKGGVCGIIQFTRGRGSTLGGDALLTKKVFQVFPELVDMQQKFHKQDRRWYDCLTPLQCQELGLEDPSPAIEIFISYADVEEDSRMLEKLENHLSDMQRRNLITIWHKGRVAPGKDKRREVSIHLETARIILLMVSADFMALHYRDGTEVKRAMERCNNAEARVIPVILRPADWESAPFGHLAPLPSNGKPVTIQENSELVYDEIRQRILSVVNELRNKSSLQMSLSVSNNAPISTEAPVYNQTTVLKPAEKHVISQLEGGIAEQQKNPLIKGLLNEHRHSLEKVGELKGLHNMLHDIESSLMGLQEAIWEVKALDEREESKLSLIRWKRKAPQNPLKFRAVIRAWKLVKDEIIKIEDFIAQDMKVLTEEVFLIKGNNICGPDLIKDLLLHRNSFDEALRAESVKDIEEASNELFDACSLRLFSIDRKLFRAVKELDFISDQFLRSMSNE